MLSGIGQGNNLAFLSSSATRPAIVGRFTMDVTGNDTPCERATAVMTHVLSRITTLYVRLLGCIFWIPRLAGGGRDAHRQKHAIVRPHFAIGYAPISILIRAIAAEDRPSILYQHSHERAGALHSETSRPYPLRISWIRLTPPDEATLRVDAASGMSREASTKRSFKSHPNAPAACRAASELCRFWALASAGRRCRDRRPAFARS
jgi:hypothetical protein